MSRWKMNKLGFLNFWLYDQEEFSLRDGHILLRGNNASGKSITTQSFIPFLLDGNKSPERLDPFGSKDRRMEFYLLGDGDQEESTGYLYLEFKKEGLEEYLTVGVGQRAQRGKKMDFWGFCLNDGRRVGPGGLMLYERIGGQMIPLSKPKLKNLIETDNWAESPETYKKLVNRQVFQFQDIRQYDQLIGLLIKVRTPKLSKDFRPSAVKQVLRDSLQVLSDEDLSAMVTTMERMDQLEDTLRDYRAALRDAEAIRSEYTRYNQYILGMKGSAYLGAHSEAVHCAAQLRDAQDRLEKLERALQEQRSCLEEAEALLQRASAQRAALGDDDLAAQRGRLEEERTACQQYARQLEEGQERLKKLQESVSRKEADLRRQQRDLSDAQDAIQSGVRELEAQEEVLSLGDEHDQYLRDLKTEQAESSRLVLAAALQRRKKQIAEVRACLAELGEAKAAYDAACQELDRAGTAELEARSLLQDARQQEQQERDRLLEDIARREAASRELRFSSEEMQDLRRMVSRYRTQADWSAVKELMNACYLARLADLQNAQNRGRIEFQKLREEEGDIRRELKRLQDQPDPVPSLRREQIQATRVQLLMQGIPHAPFYETVDFAPELPQEARDLLEAQLTDAGLLDALVVPAEHLEAVKELLQTHPDRFLLPGAPAADPVAGLVPEGEGPFQEAARACLAGISQSDWEAETALLPDGRFRCGAVQGYSRPEGPAGFVGIAARRANKERQIRELTARLEEAERLVREKRAELDVLRTREEVLREEQRQMPTAVDLDHALEMLEQAQKNLVQAEERKEACLQAERSAKQTVGRVEQTSRDLSRGLPYMRTEEGYDEALNAAEEYQRTLNALAIDHNKMSYAAQTVEATDSHIAELRDQISDMEKDSARTRGQMEIAQARIQTIREFLDQPENREKAQRRAGLDQEIQTQQERRQDAEKECAVLETKLDHARAELQKSKDAHREAGMDERDLEHYFLEDEKLGLSALQEGTLEERAQEAAGKVRPEDRERTSEHLGEALHRNCQQHSTLLHRYHINVSLMFEAPSKAGALRQRLCVTLQWEGKELPLYDFIRELQAKVDMTATVLEERDRELFENILTETIGLKLRARIEESQQWAKDMTALMRTLVTSMGLTFCLDWRPKKSEGEAELDTAQLVQLLNKDRAFVTREDSQRISNHFRTKVKRAREKAALDDQTASYADLIREVLDYRNWYEFQLMYERSGEQKKELTDRVFNKFSGGEKAMAMYVPLFAAVSAQYAKSGPQCPRLLALDEAFAGVDERNIDAMFELVEHLDFDYIMNSQALWGCYNNVKSLDIAELHRPANASVVTILRYHWNGSRRALEDG